MTYIYKKTLGSKTYYYLRISERVKGKVIVKDIAYLGNDASKVEKKLKELPKKYNDEIRKAYRNIKKFVKEEYYLNKVKEMKIKENDFIKKELLEEIEAIKLHYKKEFLKKDELTKKEVFKNFLIEFAYNSTSLEGNTITLAEANKLLNEQLTPKDKTLREIYDLQNTENVFFELINSKRQMSNDFIIKLHDELMEKIDLRKGFRTHDIRVFKSKFDASPFPYIKADMNLLQDWLKKNDNMNTVVLSGIFHQKFEKIHPFSDGNGRTGRMIMNQMLMRKGYPPLIIRKSNRSKYLEKMGQGNKSDLDISDPKYYKELIEFLAEEMIASYWNNFNI